MLVKLSKFLAWLRKPIEEVHPPPRDLSPIHRRIKDRKNLHLESLEAYQEWFNQVARRPLNHTVLWQRYYIVKKFRPNPGESILDMGSYVGNNLIRYAKDGYQIDGIEVGEAYIRTFEERAETKALFRDEYERIRVFPTLIERFKPDRQYDRILCTELLEHVIDPVDILKKAHECLRKEGEVFIAVPLNKRCRTDVRDVGLRDLESWLRNAGFKKWIFEEIHPERYDDGSKDWGVAQLLCFATK